MTSILCGQVQIQKHRRASVVVVLVCPLTWMLTGDRYLELRGSKFMASATGCYADVHATAGSCHAARAVSRRLSHLHLAAS